MARIHQGADGFDAVVGGWMDPGAKEWLSGYANQVYNTFSGAGQALVDRSRELYQMIDESSAVQMLRNLRHKHDHLDITNQVSALRSMESLQTASPYMQRWIMAEPELRKRYLNQEVDGYSDTYVNYHGDAVGSDHYDYRRILSGLVETQGDDEDYICRIYADELPPGDKELTPFQQFDVLDTWARVTRYLDEGGEDPTSVYGDNL